MMIKKNLYILTLLLSFMGMAVSGYAQSSRIRIYGNIYGGGELAQVVAKDDDALDKQLVTDDKLHSGEGGLFNKDANHSYTTYVKLSTGAEIFGKVFGGGMGKEGGDEEVAGLVEGQTDVVLEGATTWERIFGGGEMADVSGNTLVHFKKGKMAHDAFGGGLGKVTQTKDTDGETILPDNRQTVLASADIKKITGKESTTGNTFVVFDGEDENHTEYEYKILKTYEVNDGEITETEFNQFDASRENKLFLTDHNIYGGGMTAANVAGNTYTHINYGMVSEAMLNEPYYDEKQWDIVYNSIANAQFCVFGGGYGYHAQVGGNTNVTMDIEGSRSFRYLTEFKTSFNGIWDGVNPDPNVIYAAAETAKWSHGAPGRSCMDIVGGGYNGKVQGSTNVTIGGDVVVRKVYGGGYYASVNETNVTIKSGLFNRVYGGGLIGNVYGKANLTYGQQYDGENDTDIKAHNAQLLVKSAIYGGNDISGTVGTVRNAKDNTNASGVTYPTYNPKDDADHGVRMNIYGGLVLGDVYGAGNGNHTGYTNPENIQFSLSQHPSENYRQMQKPGQSDPAVTAPVYKYRPRTAHVVMNIEGNEGDNFSDGQAVDKVRIWGRTFGGGNSCNVGIWDGTKDDNAEKYAADETSWHPGNNFLGGGTIDINIGSHVQLGNRNDSHDAPNGLFMGCNGQEMVTQSTKPDELEYYHHYFNPRSHTYLPGFLVYDAEGNDIGRKAGLKSFADFINNILTWSDNVHLNISDEAQDIWMSNFVGGGYRGSMKAKTPEGTFYYRLPKGVTVGHAVVGGSYNAHIVYRIYKADEHGYAQDGQGNYMFQTEIPGGWVKDNGTNNGQYLKELYEDEEHPDQITAILRYNFDGGMLAMSSGLNAEDNAHNTRIHQIHNPSSLTTADFTCDGGYFTNKEKALVRLELKNRLHPAVHDPATDKSVKELNVHGGIVYGGCYMTGYVEGDSWVDYDCSLSPLCTDDRFFGKRNKAIYDEVADLNRNNALNIFGAGFGTDTHSMGDVYLCVKTSGGDTSSENGDWPFIYNVFGGGNMGTVAGSTNVYYDGGKQGTMLGSLYGGGFKGDIDGNTYVELVQGFLVNVYGGSRQANIGGAAHVWAYDGSTRATTGLSGQDSKGKDIFNHLIICNMYGGNDISGEISGTMPATWTKNVWTDLEGKNFNSYIQVSGTNPGTKGFPLVGNVYGGGNGEQWSEELGAAPNVGTSLLEIDGGTTLEAFGGGNKATITGDAYIFINATGENYADVQFTEYQKGILEDKFFKTVRDGYTWNGTELQMSAHHVDNLFGGNNVAAMAIQPKWNLKQGKIGNVYSGGNMGDMTYYNPDADTEHGETKGLRIDVNSDDIYIESLYGGCRMSDVKAMVDANTQAPTFGTDEYGATVNVIKGNIGNVYGGNDISGYVYNGTNVNLSGSITGNVYGAGNGNYLYAYDKTGDIVGDKVMAEVWNKDVNKFVYWIPGTEGDSQLKQLVSLTNARPHVAKAYLNIQGQDEDNKVYISGSVYCGGNASTIRSTGQETGEAHVKFNIGNNVIVNKVFMGSNGESMKYDANGKNNYLVEFEKVNKLDFGTNMSSEVAAGKDHWDELLEMYSLSADKKELIKTIYPNLLSVYMSAVDMKAMPLGFTEFSGHEFQNTWIGTFCMGGNAGSMMTDKPVDIIFPQSLNFFGRIIGGSMDASFQYKEKWHRGGFRMPLASDAELDDAPTKTKLRMKIRGDWYSRRMVMEDQYKTVGTYAPMGDYLVLDKTNDGVNWNPAGKAWHDGCNVYGGCYQSGDMVGDVKIYIESDMLAYSRYLKDTEDATIDDYEEPSLDNSNELNLPVANVYGAGYGPESRSFGDAYIYMKDIPNVDKDTHPSVNNIFGGGRNGMLVGNSVIHVHDGLVYKDVVGGSFAAPMYGSAQVTVGYPKFYVCKKSGEYFLDRADKWNEGHMTKGYKGSESVVKKSIKYFEGTYVPCNVYDQITGVKLAKTGAEVDLTSGPNNIHTAERGDNTYFDFHDESIDESLFPEGGWNSVEIRVRGGVYGGGFSLSNSTAAIAGSYTTLASIEDNGYNHGTDSQGNSSVGYGGNSSIIISDFVGKLAGGQIAKDHIKISTETTKSGDKEYTGLGGIYGDGHYVFCEGFRTAELNGYGYAEHTPSNPLMLNTLQRLDLLTINDCCFKLYGDEDFTVDELNARKYSLARIGELRMNSTIDATGTYATNLSSEKSRNYIGFYNTIHYIGAIVTNDDFHTGKFHGADGAVDNDYTYRSKKQWYIDQYHGETDEVSVNAFKQRNYATARNMVGINSGYSLHVENQYYNGEARATYYGPIVGVAEVKLLNVQPGEGGGYVYADNVHDSDNPTFMNESGNFVFEGVIRPGEDTKQYIVDDCLPTGFDECGSTLPEQHYWYVIGDTYYYNATLTAFSYKDTKTFDLTNSDPNVIFAGIEEGWKVSLESVKWLPQTRDYPDGYVSDIRGENNELEPLRDTETYKFMLQVGDEDTWNKEMPLSAGRDDEAEKIPQDNKPSGVYKATGGKTLPSTPRFNVHLLDNVNNCPLNEEEAYFNKHLSVPEKVQLIIKAMKPDGGMVDDVPTYGETKTYNVTLEIVYIQGPSFTGNVNIMNCALPGERIGFNSKDIQIKTTEQLPVTGFGWKLVPLTSETTDAETGKTTYSWDDAHSIDIPASYYTTTAEGYLQGSVPALYSQNHWNIRYEFYAGGEKFPVTTSTLETKPLDERMLVVHNYHKMADIVNNYDVALAPVPDGSPSGNKAIYAKALKPGAMIYLADADDIAAFASYVNAGNATEGMHFYLQNDLTLLTAITETFAGTLHGNGYVLSLRETEPKTLFGTNLTGKVYNLGVPNGTIATVTDASASVINCFDSNDSNDNLRYGKKAYDLSHYYTTANDEDNYVHTLFANNDGMGGDWRYGRTSAVNARYLRTAAPNYGNMQTSHNTEHADDYALTRHDCLFFGQTLTPTAEKKYPEHIDEEFSVNDWIEANRVYRTTGYYQSTDADKFHYNKVAWAMQPTLTAIDFTAANVPDASPSGFYGYTDDRPASLTSFNSDHNGTVSEYSNATTGKVTQNLLVYNSDNGNAVFKFKDLSTTTEEDVQYHNILLNGTYGTGYMHLVDKQDFCAPIAFNVTDRAWYERKPSNYAESNNDAWEGICLPFTVSKATASLNGEITHFYGTPANDTEPADNINTLHHEYWLRGLVSISSADGQTTATFQRPGSEGEEGLFSTAGQTAATFTYEYAANSNLTGRTGYNSTDNPWYTKSHNYTGYLPLTVNTPYVVSFPGSRYYEFDLTDQTITFSSAATTVPVTTAIKTTVGGYDHTGTYIHHDDATYAMNDEGTGFDSKMNSVLPFRTYMTAVTAAKPAFISITANVRDHLDIRQHDTTTADESEGATTMKLYSNGQDLTITADNDGNALIYNATGNLIRAVTYYSGINHYAGFSKGMYIIKILPYDRE